jgi:hypothetical protein
VVIDAHLHLWNTERLHYAWLQRPENAAINRTFGVGDFRSRAVQAGVDRAVLVQADDTAADTEAMFEVAAAHQEIAGVVAWVPLDRPTRRLPGSTSWNNGRTSPASAPSSTTSPTRTGCCARRWAKGSRCWSGGASRST